MMGVKCQLRIELSMVARIRVSPCTDSRRLACVRGHAADGRNFIGLSIACDTRIRGVCLSCGDRLGRLFDSEDLLRN
jgi:hypothetical protein